MITCEITATDIAIIICGVTAVLLLAVAVIVACVSRKRENRAERTVSEEDSSAECDAVSATAEASESAEGETELSDAASETAEIPSAAETPAAEQVSEEPSADTDAARRDGAEK